MTSSHVYAADAVSLASADLFWRRMGGHCIGGGFVVSGPVIALGISIIDSIGDQAGLRATTTAS